MPASATPELVAIIDAANRAQGYNTGDSPRADTSAAPPLTEIGELGEDPQLDLSARGAMPGLDRSREAEFERSLADAEARHRCQFEEAQSLWKRERQALEAEMERLAAEYRQHLEAVQAERAEIERVATDRGRQLEAVQGERDAAFRRAEGMVREHTELAERVKEVGAERDGLRGDRLAAIAEFDRLAARVSELEQALGEARARHAEELSARREEERRGLVQASERLARERDNSSEQLRDLLAQLEEALAQLEISRRQGAEERETMRGEIEAARDALARSLDRDGALPSRQEWDHYQAEVERLAGEFKRVQDEKDAESRRCGELADRLNQRDDELEQARRALVAETEAHQRALEELQLRLQCLQRSDPQAVEDLGTADVPVLVGADPAVDLPNLEESVAVERLPVEENPPAVVPVVPVVPGPNPPNSPDERIAALRTYLRKVQEADKERLNQRLLRRLIRAWRHEEP
ncbi:hypothetical protein [Singulisphaera sp. GP187]|uniref:hypothetical protein n=1 Tax=Singulisphaera sp. GP187 TaxID=1882752 RepID=UPI0020B10912|nr:hypothetical protein [Singulisphaera sp. GP187]